MRVTELVKFIEARHAVALRKAVGAPKPWTKDPILQSYRFCNVYRELDTVTRWIAANWRDPNEGHEDLWFAMAVARWVNWPESLEDIGLPLPWKPKRFMEALYARRAYGQKVWTGAYMIGTQGNAMDKCKFICEGVLQPLWDNRKTLRPNAEDSLASFAQRVIDVKNQGRFMVGQIVADIKYDMRGHLYEASDWFTWAVSGPGSRRGLNRVLGRDKGDAWREPDFLQQLTKLRDAVNAKLKIEPLHAQDLQNCLCEFDKYERVRLGEGRPRSLYQGV